LVVEIGVGWSNELEIISISDEWCKAINHCPLLLAFLVAPKPIFFSS
jgi:hypothetical protein